MYLHLKAVEFEWDEKKNKRNIRIHGIDFNDACEVFKTSMLVDHDDREDYGEDRWIGLGMMQFLVIAVIFTEPAEDTYRIISARKATKNEVKKYEKKLKDGLG